MIKISEETMNERVLQLPGSKAVFKTEETEGQLNIEQELAKHGDLSESRFAQFMLGNNEQLPFEDAQFDSYVANLSLHLVNNPDNMIKEAFRVMQSGSPASFSIWGRRENCQYFFMWQTVLEEV
jgi:ubiquinone/menaquinone biosynthesis C-methylase UbiE